MNQVILRYRLLLSVVTTALIIVLSLLAAYALRFDLMIPAEYWPRIVTLIPLILAIKLAVFWSFYCFRGWWRYVSVADLILIAKANVISSLLLAFIALVLLDLDRVPRSVVILDGVLCFLMIGGVRFIVRAIREEYFPLRQGTETRPRQVLIVGAGAAGQAIVREVRQNARLDMHLVGFIDDDSAKRSALIQGLKVLGNRDDLKKMVQIKRVEEVIIAIPSATGHQIRSLVDQCRNMNINFKVLPSVGELIGGKILLQQVRELDLNDLLGRETINLDMVKIRADLGGKRVLITGAGGSIGSELCRQVARFDPAVVVLFDNAETPLFRIEQELLRRFPKLKIAAVIGDVRNFSQVDVVFKKYQPEVVFHTAAYKHVPMMENNPAEAVNCNVQGTRILADAADRCRVNKFVMVSTDKAVRPTNVMGTSKRIAELYVQALNHHSATAFVTTRFGNVLGSNGSVIPTFKDQISRGGPVTVTHPEVTRFFMTIPEASQLVLQAGSMGEGGEIFLFDMGEPVKIKHLAEEVIRLSGLKPYEDIDIIYTGLRPGEKLYEELLLSEEGVLPTSHGKICVARSMDVSLSEIRDGIDALLADAKVLNISGVLSKIRVMVPEYQPAEHSNPPESQAAPNLGPSPRTANQRSVQLS